MYFNACNIDPDQTLPSETSVLSLHYLPILFMESLV